MGSRLPAGPFWAGLVAMTMATGCNGLWGVDDLRYEPAGASSGAGGRGGAGGSGGSAGDGTGGAGAAPGCPDGTVCRGTLADGQFVTPPKSPACEPGQTAVTLAVCGACDCQPGSGGACEVTIELHASSACTNPLQTLSQGGTNGNCSNFTSTDGSPTVHAQATAVGTPASCNPVTDEVDTTTLTACTAPLAGPCPAGVCVPEALRCLLLPDGEPCPSPYALERMVYPAQTSRCDCSCAAEATCPTANVWTYPGTGCDGGGQAVPKNDSCHDTTLQSARSVWLLAGAATTACTASASAPNALQLCCLPDSAD